MCMWICKRIYEYIYVHMCIYIYICTYIYTHICTYMYICIVMHRHTCVYIYIYIRKLEVSMWSQSRCRSATRRTMPTPRCWMPTECPSSRASLPALPLRTSKRSMSQTIEPQPSSVLLVHMFALSNVQAQRHTHVWNRLRLRVHRCLDKYIAAQRV